MHIRSSWIYMYFHTERASHGICSHMLVKIKLHAVQQLVQSNGTFFWSNSSTGCICSISIIYHWRATASKISTIWKNSTVIVCLCVVQIVFSRSNHFTSYYPSSAAQSHFLSQFLLDGGSVSVPQHLYSIHAQTYSDNRAANLVPPPVADSISPTSNTQQDRDHPCEDRSTATAEAAVRHVDSSSLSEDDVFYN